MNLAIFNLFWGRHVCRVCKKETEDILSPDGGRREIFFCRDHLIQKFEESFLNYPHKAIICAPNMEKYYNSHYLFFPISEFKKWKLWDFAENDLKIVSNLLKIVSLAKCSICGSNAQNLYFDKSIYKSDGSNIANLRNYKGVYLCAKHSLEKIIEPIRNNQESFDDWGVFLPYEGEGIFISTQI